MDQLICASLSHIHYWYEVGMFKVPADCHLIDVWYFPFIKLEPKYGTTIYYVIAMLLRMVLRVPYTQYGFFYLELHVFGAVPVRKKR